MFGMPDTTERDRKLRAEFSSLLADDQALGDLKEIKVGHRVLVAAGLLHMGLPWARKEAEVVEVAETAVKLQFLEKRYDDTYEVLWAHRALIVEVLPAAEPVAAESE